LSEIVHALREDEWRRQLNRTVREFSAGVVGTDDESRQALVHTMLRDIGEALDVECCTLAGVSPSQADGGPRYHWCRSTVTGKPFEGAAFEALLEQVTRAHHPVALHGASDDGMDDQAAIDARAHLRETSVHSAVIIPTGVEDDPKWAWVLGTVREDWVCSEAVIEHLQVLGDVVSGVLQRRRPEPEVAERDDDGTRLPLRGRAAPPIRSVFPTNRGFEEIIGQSRALRAALATLEEVVHTDSIVLLLGETGTGKELFARALHARGPRRAFPLVCVNCGALPPTLIESELFGHQRGAFTGAVAPRQGRFELAHRGTLFLDEIGDLPMDLQAKLLRVLQEGAFERVGSSQTQTVNVRIIAATHRDIGRAMASGEFRADLYYRLNVFPIRLPPLRERKEDIPSLVWAMIGKRQAGLRRHITHVPAEVWDALQSYAWPGNVRELENVVERALIHSTGGTLTLAEGSLESFDVSPDAGTTLMSVERAHIEGVLRECGWRINGIGGAAERLGLHPNTLRFRMKKLGIVRHDSTRDARGQTVRSNAPSKAQHWAS
jgi:transcriptional regulator with GAF, ATPase, and Fis domain